VPHSVNPLAHEIHAPPPHRSAQSAEMKEKYGDTLQVDGVVGEDDDKSMDESNKPFATRSTAVLRTSSWPKNQGCVRVTVELPLDGTDNRRDGW
jgi:hypothetical protein